MAHNTAATGSQRSGVSGATGAHATGTRVSGRISFSTAISRTGSSTKTNITLSPTSTGNPTETLDYKFTTTMAGSLDTSLGVTGMQTYCACGETMAGINIATSANATTSYYALGEPVPLGFTQVPSENGLIILSPSQTAPQASASASAAEWTDGAFVDASCFNELDLLDYLLYWWTANSATCAYKNVQFAECFYALETKYAPPDCAPAEQRCREYSTDMERLQKHYKRYREFLRGLESPELSRFPPRYVDRHWRCRRLISSRSRCYHCPARPSYKPEYSS